MLSHRWAYLVQLRIIIQTVVLGLTLCHTQPSWADQGFQPVSMEELKLTSEPLAPGAPAIILYHQVDRDDSIRGDAHQFNYLRIKILTEEGRKYADVELPFVKGLEDIVHINARTIKRDGTIVNFDGKVFDKSLVKSHKFGLLAKTFTLPEVEVGSIIEYFYTMDLNYVYDSHWIVNEDLFIKNARFSLKPYRGGYVPISLRISWKLPPGSEPKEGPDHIYRLEVSNVPAFQREDYMPPVNEMKSRVDFIYQPDLHQNSPEQFWQMIGKSWNGKLEGFIDKRKAMEQAVAQIVGPDDVPEVKLRKIYARVQEIRNKSYEVKRTEQEEKRDKERVDLNVEDVWKRGYGSGVQLTWLYLALVRAAGFEAYGCWVPSRREYFFDPKMMESGKLRANVVMIKLNGKDLFLDPGAEFTPFGMLTWSETGVQGLRLDKDGGGWIRTPVPQSSESQIERRAKLKLSEAGELEGKLIVTYTGLEAMYHRLEVRNADDIARKKYAEEWVVGQIALPAQAELTNKPEWSSSEPQLVAEFDLKVPGWVSSAGKRATLPAALFTAHEKHIFEHANRVHPIYFDYPYRKVDDVTIELPAGWQVTSPPPLQALDLHVVSYDLKVENDKNSLHLVRKLAIDLMFIDQKYYGALRSFFEVVRTTDEEQIVLQPSTATTSN